MMFKISSSINVDTFRQKIKNGYLPDASAINEGLFGEYYFQVGTGKPVTELVRVNCSVARTKNPLYPSSQETENYLGLGLLSSEDGKNQREDLNLSIVLDVSGSMSSTMQEVTAEDQGQPSTVTKSKLDIAKEVILQIFETLKPHETLNVILFDDRTEVLLPVTKRQDVNDEDFKTKLQQVSPRGGTTMKIGLELAVKSLQEYHQAAQHQANKNNRVLFLTDAQPNSDEKNQLIQISTEAAAKHKIYVTYIGIGLDFNTKLVNSLTQVRGTNYFGVHSAFQFRKILNEEFNYVVTPLCFDINVAVKSDHFEIEKVYGAPDSKENTSSLMHVETLMASALSKQGVKGGLVLLRLKQKESTTSSSSSSNHNISVTVTYLNKDTLQTVEKVYTVNFLAAIQAASEDASLENTPDNIFSQEGIRKGVMLARYTDTMLAVIKDAAITSATTFDAYNPSPAVLQMVTECKKYMEAEKQVVEDNQLNQEIQNLSKCIKSQ